MIVIVVFIWIIATLGEIIFRSALHSKSWKKDDKNWWWLILIWLALLIVGYLIFPLIRLALSRKREYLADAGSVILTKDKYALISALQKISQDSAIESIKKNTVAAMCIESPFTKDSKSITSIFRWLTSTHPSIEDRINTLKQY
jgi:heat shock protein HtpX